MKKHVPHTTRQMQAVKKTMFFGCCMVDHPEVGINRLFSYSCPLSVSSTKGNNLGCRESMFARHSVIEPDRERTGTGAGGTPIHVPPSAHVIFLMP